jgi:hypothetical protein
MAHTPPALVPDWLACLRLAIGEANFNSAIGVTLIHLENAP